MIHTTSTLAAQTGQQLFTQSWLPDTEAKAILVIAHGLGEHSNRYLPLVEYFVAEGYGIYALDHEGHGQSEGLRGYINRFDDYVVALDDLIDSVAKSHADKKLFLVGHSMGGAISVNYLLKHQQKLSGCLLSGSALSVGQVISPIQQQVLKVLSLLCPKKPLIQLDGAAVSRDPAVVEAYLNDPLVYGGKHTARLLAEIVKAANRALSEAGAITLPMLIMHGGGDLMAAPDGSETLYNNVSSVDKSLKIYPGLYHEIFLEKEKLEVFDDMAKWLASHA